MDSEAFFKEIRAGKVRPLYLFEGEEEYAKERGLKELRKAVLTGAFPGLNEAVLQDPSADAVMAVAETLPFMDEKRLVIVRDSGLLAGPASRREPAGNGGKKGAGGEDDRLLAYLDRLPETCCLVFYMRGKASSSRRLYRKIASLGGHVGFAPLPAETLVKWIARELKGLGKDIGREAAQQLILAVGTDMTRLDGEISKLAAYAADSPAILPGDVDRVCSKSVEYRVFDLSDALAARKTAQSIRLMNGLLADGEQRLALLALLQRQYRQLFFLKLLEASGASRQSVAEALGLPGFVVGRLQAAAAGRSAGELLAAYDLCVETEYLVKSGQIPEEGCLEQAVFRLLTEDGHGGDPG